MLLIGWFAGAAAALVAWSAASVALTAVWCAALAGAGWLGRRRLDEAG